MKFKINSLNDTQNAAFKDISILLFQRNFKIKQFDEIQ